MNENYKTIATKNKILTKKSTNNNKTNGIQISINYYGQNKKLKIITQNINKKTISTLNNNKKNLIKNKIPFKKRKIPNSL